MVSPLQRLAISFPLSVVLLGAISLTIALQPPRSILAFLLSYLFPVVCIVFAYLFVRAFNGLAVSHRNSIARFGVPIIAALLLLACSVWLGIHIAAVVHH